MNKPKVDGNTRRERLARLRSVGCPEGLLDRADQTLAFWVTPMKLPGGWRVMAPLSDITARQAVRYERGRA